MYSIIRERVTLKMPTRIDVISYSTFENDEYCREDHKKLSTYNIKNFFLLISQNP